MGIIILTFAAPALRTSAQVIELPLAPRDAAFILLLKERWVEVAAEAPATRDSEPKPVRQPEGPPAGDRPAAGDSLDIRPREAAPKAESVDRERPEPILETEPRKLPEREFFSFTFYQLAMAWPAVQPLNMQVTTFQTKELIAAAWEVCARWPHQGVVTKLHEFAQANGLDDWSVFLLANTVADRLPGVQGGQQRTLLTWFLMSKLGYDLKVAFGEQELFLLLPVAEHLFGVTYFPMEGKSYYLLRDREWINSVPKLRTFPGNYSEKTRVLSRRLSRTPELSGKTSSRTVAGLPLKLSDDCISYGNSLPQTELSIYFNTPISGALLGSLKQRFSPADGTPEQHLNAVLSFIQNGLAYQTDQDQFGRERALFADESCFYPFADCEDRSILFARIMREIYGYEVIGLSYPGHVAAAVHLPEPIQGDAVLFEGRRFLICDPTYINARAGVCMPKFARTAPGVIEVE